MHAKCRCGILWYRAGCHHLYRPGNSLFRRLEQEPDILRQLFSIQFAGSGQKHGHVGIVTAGMHHAGEIETAMMLYLRPELVDLSKATREFPKAPAEFSYRPMHWNEIMETGSFGDGGAATAELGKALMDSAVETTAKLINELLK